PFQIFPAHLAALLPPDWLRGKIVLIGSLVPGEDEHRTPLAILTRPLHGVEIHAHALSQILEHGTSEDNAWVRPILVAAAAAAGTALATYTTGAWFVAGLVLLLMLIWASAIAGFAAFGGPPIVPLAPSLGLAVAAGSIRAWQSSSERRDKRTLQ